MIVTALTEMFGLTRPIVLGPMGGVSGGRLAAAVSNAGGLGLVGGGYGDPAWLRGRPARTSSSPRAPKQEATQAPAPLCLWCRRWRMPWRPYLWWQPVASPTAVAWLRR